MFIPWLFLMIFFGFVRILKEPFLYEKLDNLTKKTSAIVGMKFSSILALPTTLSVPNALKKIVENHSSLWEVNVK